MNREFGILLENGYIHRIYCTRGQARAAMKRQNDAHRAAKVEESIIVPRRAIGLIRYKVRKGSRAAAEIGRNGGLARTAKLSPERRSEIAKAAAEKRWRK